MLEENSLSNEERCAAILRLGEHGDIIVEIASQPNILNKISGINFDTKSRAIRSVSAAG